MRTIEEAILLAVLNEDEAEADRLASEMLGVELFHLSTILTHTKRIVDRQFWQKKSQREVP